MGDDDEGEPEYKFEWQRTWGHAPKESYLADGDQFAEQPFGIQVCQAKCMKCGAFGHMNTDKRCPLYGKAHDSDAPLASRDSDKLITEMRQEGMAMRYNTWNLGGSAGGKEMEDTVPNVPKGPVVDRAALLKGMSKEEKKALLKKLEKMEKKKEKKQKKKKRNDTSDEDSDDAKGRIKKEPESVRRDRDVKRELQQRRGEREIKREPESRRGEYREPESRRGERDSSSEDERRERGRSVEKRRRRSYSRDEERKNRRDRSRDRR